MEASKVKPGRKYGYQLRVRSGVMKLTGSRVDGNKSTWYDGVDVETKRAVSVRLSQLSAAPAAAAA